MPGSMYEVRVEGRVPDGETGEFGEFVVDADPQGAMLRGYVVDPAALHRVVLRLEVLGLRPTEIRRLDRDPEPGSAR